MGRVRYARDPRDTTRAPAGEGVLARTIRMVRCVYETDAEVVQAVVPRPLETRAQPEVEVWVAAVETRVDADVTTEIRSGCFGVRVEYDGLPGVYPLTMPISEEAAVTSARERFGEPAKCANVEFEIAGDAISVSVERMDVTYLRATGRRVESLGPRAVDEVAYCFKAFPSCDPAKDFDQDPLLVRLDRRHRFDRVSRLDGGLELWDSAFDPVADLPVRRLSRFEYAEGTTRSVGRVLRPIPGDWLTPFLHQRFDAPETLGLDV